MIKCTAGTSSRDTTPPEADAAPGSRGLLVRRELRPTALAVSPTARMQACACGTAASHRKKSTPNRAHDLSPSLVQPESRTSTRTLPPKRSGLSPPDPEHLKHARLEHTVYVQQLAGDRSAPANRGASASADILTVVVRQAGGTPVPPALKYATLRAAGVGPVGSPHEEALNNSPTTNHHSSATASIPTRHHRSSTPMSPFPCRAAGVAQHIAADAAVVPALPKSPDAKCHRISSDSGPTLGISHLKPARPSSATAGDAQRCDRAHARAVETQQGMVAVDAPAKAAPNCSEPSAGSAVTNAQPPTGKEYTPETEVPCAAGAAADACAAAADVRERVGDKLRVGTYEEAGAACSGRAAAEQRGIDAEAATDDSAAVMRLNGGDPVRDGECQADDRPRTEGGGRDAAQPDACASAAAASQTRAHIASTPAAAVCAAAAPEEGAAAMVRQRRLRLEALAQHARYGRQPAPGSHSQGPLVRVHIRLSQIRRIRAKKRPRWVAEESIRTLPLTTSPLQSLLRHVQQKMQGTRAEADAAITAALSAVTPPEPHLQPERSSSAAAGDAAVGDVSEGAVTERAAAGDAAVSAAAMGAAADSGVSGGATAGAGAADAAALATGTAGSDVEMLDTAAVAAGGTAVAAAVAATLQENVPEHGGAVHAAEPAAVMTGGSSVGRVGAAADPVISSDAEAQPCAAAVLSCELPREVDAAPLLPPVADAGVDAAAVLAALACADGEGSNDSACAHSQSTAERAASGGGVADAAAQSASACMLACATAAAGEPVTDGECPAQALEPEQCSTALGAAGARAGLPDVATERADALPVEVLASAAPAPAKPVAKAPPALERESTGAEEAAVRPGPSCKESAAADIKEAFAQQHSTARTSDPPAATVGSERLAERSQEAEVPAAAPAQARATPVESPKATTSSPPRPHTAATVALPKREPPTAAPESSTQPEQPACVVSKPHVDRDASRAAAEIVAAAQRPPSLPPLGQVPSSSLRMPPAPPVASVAAPVRTTQARAAVLAAGAAGNAQAPATAAAERPAPSAGAYGGGLPPAAAETAVVQQARAAPAVRGGSAAQSSPACPNKDVAGAWRQHAQPAKAMLVNRPQAFGATEQGPGDPCIYDMIGLALASGHSPAEISAYCEFMSIIRTDRGTCSDPLLQPSSPPPIERRKFAFARYSAHAPVYPTAAQHAADVGRVRRMPSSARRRELMGKPAHPQAKQAKQRYVRKHVKVKPGRPPKLPAAQAAARAPVVAAVVRAVHAAQQSSGVAWGADGVAPNAAPVAAVDGLEHASPCAPEVEAMARLLAEGAKYTPSPGGTIRSPAAAAAAAAAVLQDCAAAGAPAARRCVDLTLSDDDVGAPAPPPPRAQTARPPPASTEARPSAALATQRAALAAARAGAAAQLVPRPRGPDSYQRSLNNHATGSVPNYTNRASPVDGASAGAAAPPLPPGGANPVNAAPGSRDKRVFALGTRTPGPAAWMRSGRSAPHSAAVTHSEVRRNVYATMSMPAAHPQYAGLQRAEASRGARRALDFSNAAGREAVQQQQPRHCAPEGSRSSADIRAALDVMCAAAAADVQAAPWPRLRHRTSATPLGTGGGAGSTQHGAWQWQQQM
eukprot:jgi/Ulvmu1/2540/UM139_0008.1